MKRAGPLWTGFFIFGTARAGSGPAKKAGSHAAAATRDCRDQRQEQLRPVAPKGNPATATKKSNARSCTGLFLLAIGSFNIRIASDNGR